MAGDKVVHPRAAARVLIVFAVVIAAFLAGQRARPVAVHQVSQRVARDAARRPSLASLQSKLNGLARNVTKLKKQLAANGAADAGFLTRTDAAAYLKTADANAQFLKADGTAVNAQRVGGIAADGLVQGSGQLQTNAVTIGVAGTESQLLGDGSVRVLAGLSNAAAPYLKVANDTASPLQLTYTGANASTSVIAAHSTVTLTPTQAQVGIQVFDATSRLWAVTVSDASTGAGAVFAGQWVTGLH